jgi:hypothetical protein
MKLEYSRHIFENMGISNFKKILPVGAELFCADGQTKLSERSLLAVLRTRLLSALDNNF